MGQTNQIVHMIMPSKDNFYNGRKGIGFENPSYFEKAKYLRPALYDEKVMGLGYTLMFLIHSDEALEIEKFKRSRENKIEFAYDYGNLNASYQTSSLKPYVSNVILEKIIIDLEDKVVSLLEKEKANLEIIESLKSKGFESSENVISESENQSENDCLEIEKECDKVENSKVIAPRMFKLSVSQSVSPILMSQSSCDYKNVDIKLKRKRHKRKLSKQNDKQVNNDVSCANSDFVHFLDLYTFSSVRRPKNSGVIWKKNGSFNTSNVDLSTISLLKLNKNVKRYSRKDLLSCNNSHLGETSSAYVCNDAINVSCNPKMCDLLDDNNFFIFDDESVRISPVIKMPFRKKPHDSMNARFKSNMIKYLPRTVRKWLPKMQPLAEPVAKWFPRIVHICLWIIDSRCSKHMTGNRALLMNFVEKFLGTVRFGNNNFVVIAGYGDVVIETGKFSNPSVSQVSESSKKDLEDLFQKFYDEYFDSSKIMKSSTTNVETSINEEVFHEVSESFQGESFSSSLNDDVQQSPEEVILPQINTQSISNNMVPNVDEASTSHNKWTKDHPLHNIIGDPKSSVRTRGQLANSCLFSCLLSSIEPANVAEALRDDDWVSAMEEELDQFARLKV
nr:hypothetical protein [Tanacetum cinerariifolium]